MSRSGAFGRRGLGRLLLALAVAAATATAAHAQEDAPPVISPLRVETDHNGVNIVTGRIEIEGPVLSAPGAPNLRFDRVQNAAPYVRGKWQGSGGAVYETGSFSIHTGTGTSESFGCVEADCTSATLTGSIFRPTPTGGTFRQAGTGIVWRFTRLMNPATETIQSYASQVEHPNGETIGYDYDEAQQSGTIFYRPNRLTSNLGYYIAIHYLGESFSDPVAWGTVREAALYRDGATPVLIRRLVYSGNTVTDYGDNPDDEDGRVFACSGCIGLLGDAKIERADGSLQLPGEASATLQVAAVPGSPGGGVVGTVTRDGVTWTYAYEGLGYNTQTQHHTFTELTVTGPEGYEQVYDIGSSPQVNVIDGVTDSIGRRTAYEYDFAHRPVRIVYPRLNEVSVGYDSLGNIESRTARPGAGRPGITETADYPDPADPAQCDVLCWRPTSYRDGLNRETDLEYNSSGQMTVRLDPPDDTGARRRTEIDYQSVTTDTEIVTRRKEVRVCRTGPAACGTNVEVRTVYDYDPAGPVLLPSAERRIDPATGTTLTTTYAYDPAGRMTMSDGPLAGQDDATFYRYDSFGRRTWEIGPFGANGARIARRHTYRNSDDRITRTEIGTLPNETSETLTVRRRIDYVFDTRRNPVRETLFSGVAETQVERRFDLRGRLECEARRMNPAAFLSAPADGCVVGPAGTGANDFGADRITRFTYDDAGQLLVEQRAYGRPLQQNYATYTYDDNGNRTGVTDANGNRAELRYDGFNRLERWVFPSRTTPGQVNENDYEAYGYDLVGNRTSLRKRDGLTLTYTYDDLNRMTRKTVPERPGLDPTHTRDVFYAYDVRDLTTHARFDSHGGEGIANDYDGFGRLTASTTSMDGRSRRLEHLYDAGGRRTRLTWPGSQAVTYGWDAAGRLTGLYRGIGTANPFATWTYNIRGLPTARAEAGGSGMEWTWDPIERLASERHMFVPTTSNLLATFAYNPASQIVTRTRNNDAYVWTGADRTDAYSVNGLNQYTAVDGVAHSYDANGNLTSDGVRTFKYDNENRLVSRTGAAGGTTTLRYDPLGRLHEVAGTQATTEFLWDGDALVSEYDDAGTLLRRYAHGGQEGVDDPLVWTEAGGGGTHRLLHSDHQGSIVAIAEPDGSTRAINRYDEWGVPAAGNQGRFGFTGQIWLPELGLYHYKGRMYAPGLGRFMQTDPIGYEGGINLYAYVANDPVNMIDPTGMIDIYIGGGGDDWFTHQVENYARGRGVYFNWGQPRAIVRAIRQAHARGEPINVIGHSYGGAAGINAVHLAGVRVDLLITVDPVGGIIQPRRAGWNAREWVNVTANPESWDRSDWIAAIGGKVPASATGGADENISSGAHHGAFATMMREINAEGRIRNSNRDHRRRLRRARRQGGSGAGCPELRPGFQCGASLEIVY